MKVLLYVEELKAFFLPSSGHWTSDPV